MNGEHEIPDLSPVPGTVSRRALLGALGASVVLGSGQLARGRGLDASAWPRSWRPLGAALPSGWLDAAPMRCLFRSDDNFNSGSGSLSTEMSGEVGGKALLLRSIITDSYEAMSFSGHFGEDAAAGTVSFASADENTFSAAASLGPDSVSLTCPAGGTSKTGWAVTGRMGGEVLSARVGGPGTTVSGDWVKFFFGTLGSTSFDLTGKFHAEDAFPSAFKVAMRQGGVTADSSMAIEIWESPYVGSFSGTLSGPPVLLIAGLGWWTAFVNQTLEGFTP